VVVGLGLVPVRAEVERPGGDGTVVTALPAGRLEAGSMVTLTVGVAPTAADPGPQPVTSSTAKPKPKPKPKPGHGHGKAKGHHKK